MSYRVARTPKGAAASLAVWRWLRLFTAFCPSLAALACARDSTRNDAATQAAKVASVAAAADTDDFGAPLPRDGRFSARVVSLNPTATEVLFAIGAEGKLVGRSQWDEYPAGVQLIAPVGDGIRPNVEAVLAARPTLVILYAAPENRVAADALARAGVRTIALRVDAIAQFMSLCQTLGVAVDAHAQAARLADSVQRTLDRVRDVMRDADPVPVVWPLWQSPVMAVGRGSYLNELLQIAGARNVFGELPAPSPQVSIEEIIKRNPRLVIASEKTATALRASSAWRAVDAVRNERFLIDDPSITGRPSVVLGMAAVALARKLHPERAALLP